MIRVIDGESTYYYSLNPKIGVVFVHYGDAVMVKPGHSLREFHKNRGGFGQFIVQTLSF